MLPSLRPGSRTLASPSALPFAQIPKKAWDRVAELVVYDPAQAPSAAVLEAGGQQFGLRISDLHMEFDVKRSQTYAENTGEFRIYNASETTRRQMEAPGLRVRFSVGYAQQGGAVGIFWGSITSAYSKREGTSWVTVLTCISSLTEATGTEDIATWAKKNKNATPEQKAEVITRATNRIPVSLSKGPDTRIRDVLRDLSVITGLALYGVEGMGDILLPNGWTYVGGVRGALNTMDKMLRSRGWHLYIDNTTIVVVPLDGGNLTTTAAFYSYATGLLELTPKDDPNIPPKFDRRGKRIVLPRSYEFKALINPNVGPNTLVQLETEAIKTVVLVSSAQFAGNNYGGDFSMSCVGTVWNGPGDTYRKAT